MTSSAWTSYRESLGFSPTVEVERPEHPLTPFGPDIVFAGEGRLVAIYRPTEREKAEGDSLVARLAVSRMAYPSTTVHWLVTEPSDSKLSWHFSGSGGPDALKAHLAQAPAVLLDRAMVQNKMESYFGDYFACMSASRRLEDRSSTSTGFEHLLADLQAKSASAPVWTSGRTSRFSRLFVDPRSGVALAQFVLSDARHQWQTLRAHCFRVLRYRFMIHAGIFYSRRPLDQDPTLARRVYRGIRDEERDEGEGNEQVQVR